MLNTLKDIYSDESMGITMSLLFTLVACIVVPFKLTQIILTLSYKWLSVLTGLFFSVLRLSLTLIVYVLTLQIMRK